MEGAPIGRGEGPRSMFSDDKQLGIVPVTPLETKLTCVSLVARQSALGMLPLKLFPPRTSDFKAGMVPKHVGMEPMKRLLDRSRATCHQGWVTLHKPVGMDPLSMLPFNCKMARFPSALTQAGTVP